jgi:CSLREA domain-containing protein
MFSVAISGGTAPITYQWKRNGAAIAGATSDRYILATTVFGDNATTFSVDIINAAGTLSSSTAVLTVMPINGYIVNTTADLIDDNTSDAACHTSANTCSLRAAIMQANHLIQAGTQTIYVPAGVYTLTRAKSGGNGEDNGNLNFTTPLAANQIISVVGAGAATTIIDANKIDSVLRIEIGRVANISDVTVRNGSHAELSANGGGITNLGTLTISNSIIENNRTAANGGGIMSDNLAALVINGCIIRTNIATFGGGVYTSGASIIHNK